MAGRTIVPAQLPRLCRERNDLSRRSRALDGSFTQEQQDRLNELNDDLFDALCQTVVSLDKKVSMRARR